MPDLSRAFSRASSIAVNKEDISIFFSIYQESFKQKVSCGEVMLLCTWKASRVNQLSLHCRLSSACQKDMRCCCWMFLTFCSEAYVRLSAMPYGWEFQIRTTFLHALSLALIISVIYLFLQTVAHFRNDNIWTVCILLLTFGAETNCHEWGVVEDASNQHALWIPELRS